MPQKIDQQDILIVQNIDLNCSHYDEENGYNHSDYFMVKWDGIPHRIEPGQTRRMPRYIAEHYAKHLTEHMIMKMQDESGGKKNLMNDKRLRSEIYSKIILGVDSYIFEEAKKTDGELAAQQVEELNKIEVVNQTPKEAKTDEEIAEPVKAKRTRAELILECETLGIQTTGKESVDELETKLKNF